MFQQQYKFSIAFENTSSKGYTTEKLIEAKAAGTIPIYWGNPEIAKEFNTKSFINCHEYENFDEVIEVIKKIDNDDELYLKYLNEPFSLEGFDLEKKELSDFLYNIIEKKQILRSIDKTSKGFSNYSKLVYLKKIEKIKILKKIIKIFVK